MKVCLTYLNSFQSQDFDRFSDSIDVNYILFCFFLPFFIIYFIAILLLHIQIFKLFLCFDPCPVNFLNVRDAQVSS